MTYSPDPRLLLVSISSCNLLHVQLPKLTLDRIDASPPVASGSSAARGCYLLIFQVSSFQHVILFRSVQCLQGTVPCQGSFRPTTLALTVPRNRPPNCLNSNLFRAIYSWILSLVYGDYVRLSNIATSRTRRTCSFN